MSITKSENMASRPSMIAICEQVIACLNESLQHPPPEQKKKVDEAENLLVKLRDELIRKMRDDYRTGVKPSPWRRPLDKVNTSLSLVAGAAYPSAHVHHQFLEETLQLLQAVSTELPD